MFNFSVWVVVYIFTFLFCKKKCPYCDFYSILYSYDSASKYISILTKEIRKINTKIETVYIGGGTPSVLSLHLLKELLDSLFKILKASSENTIEVNPESINNEKIEMFLHYNINRISIGVQSLKDDKIRNLGRIHSAQESLDAVICAKEKGVNNINIDLIYGLPNENLLSWKKELREAVKLPVTHISCYSLSCEPNTKFYKLKKTLDDDIISRMYCFNMVFLPKNGYQHYEVSNYSLPGFMCQHNLRYWDGSSYLGIGTSAVSFISNERKKNVTGVDEYIKRVIEDDTRIAYSERLSPKKRAKELAALKIRTKDGISLNKFREETGFDFFDIEDKSTIEGLKRRGWLHVVKQNGRFERIFLTHKGFLFCDEVSSCLV